MNELSQRTDLNPAPLSSDRVEATLAVLSELRPQAQHSQLTYMLNKLKDERKRLMASGQTNHETEKSLLLVARAINKLYQENPDLKPDAKKQAPPAPVIAQVPVLQAKSTPLSGLIEFSKNKVIPFCRKHWFETIVPQAKSINHDVENKLLPLIGLGLEQISEVVGKAVNPHIAKLDNLVKAKFPNGHETVHKAVITLKSHFMAAHTTMGATPKPLQLSRGFMAFAFASVASVGLSTATAPNIAHTAEAFVSQAGEIPTGFETPEHDAAAQGIKPNVALSTSPFIDRVQLLSGRRGGRITASYYSYMTPQEARSLRQTSYSYGRDRLSARFGDVSPDIPSSAYHLPPSIKFKGKTITVNTLISRMNLDALIYGKHYEPLMLGALQKLLDMDPQEAFHRGIIGAESGGAHFEEDGSILTSRANAMGRAQIIPDTAKYLARRYLGDESRWKEIVTEPRLNTQMGFVYFNKIRTDFGNNNALGALGYNGGPGDSGLGFRMRVAGVDKDDAKTPEGLLKLIRGINHPRDSGRDENRQYVVKKLFHLGLIDLGQLGDDVVRGGGKNLSGLFVKPTVAEPVSDGNQETTPKADDQHSQNNHRLEGVSSTLFYRYG
jgi:hypothetical protein